MPESSIAIVENELKFGFNRNKNYKICSHISIGIELIDPDKEGLPYEEQLIILCHVCEKRVSITICSD